MSHLCQHYRSGHHKRSYNHHIGLA
jgi:hypothetical protein